MKIKKIEQIETPEEVFNLHIEDNHNYFANGVCVSNCHGLRGTEVKSVSEAAINSNFRIGCTGSMPDSRLERLQIESTLGNILDIVTSKELIDIGMLSDITIKLLFLLHSTETKKLCKGIDYQMEQEFLDNLEQRNKFIKVLVSKHLTKEHNALVLVDRVEHAENLGKLMKDGFPPDYSVYVVTGKVPPEKREEIRKLVNKSKKCVIVATYGTFSTGISINRLHAIIFGSAGKSKIKTLQSIGRGLRLHKEKKKLLLYDIADDLKYSKEHMKNRVEIYNKSQFNVELEEISFEKKKSS